MKLHHVLAAIAAVFTAILIATPAAAQATRSWVSGVGDDTNPCSRTAPCKTFQGAVNKTNAGGEVDCLDPGGFGPVLISKSMTIDCHLALGSIQVSNVKGVIVEGGTVSLIGLSINGSGASPGLIGVDVLSGTVLISNSQIFGFTTAASCDLVSAGIGVCVHGPAGTKVTIENSMIFNNSIGVVNSPPSGANQVVIEHTVLNFNTTENVQNDGAGAKTFFSDDSLINSPVATLNTAGSFFSYGNNVMTGTVATMAKNALQ